MHETQYPVLYQYMADNYFPTNGSPTTDIESVVWALNYEQCFGSYATDFMAYNTYVCPSDLEQENDFVCWEDWTVANQTGCLAMEVCNWDPSITDPDECTSVSQYVDGFCYSTYAGEVVSEGPYCLFYYPTMNATYCDTLNGTWVPIESGYCVDPEAATSSSCVDSSFLQWGTDSFTANLWIDSWCYNASQNEEGCVNMWVPTVDLCIDMTTDYDTCIAEGLDFHAGRIWFDFLASATACSSGICSDLETTDNSTCTNTPYCDVTCTVCSGTSICYNENITESECDLLGGLFFCLFFPADLHVRQFQTTYCALPALTESECTAYAGTWFECSSLDATSASFLLFLLLLTKSSLCF